MSILNNAMTIKTATATIVKALNNAKRGTFKPYHWTFTVSHTETVEYRMVDGVGEFIYTRFIKFLGIKFGTERFYVKGNDPLIEGPLWHSLDVALQLATSRLYPR